MSGSPPLRFLAIVLGGWAAIRTAIVAPPWWTPPADAFAIEPPGAPRTSKLRTGGPEWAKSAPFFAGDRRAAAAPGRRTGPAGRRAPNTGAPSATAAAEPATRARSAHLAASAVPLLPAPGEPPARTFSPAAGAGRWKLSAWSFVRGGDAAALAAGGLLGGSQAGFRLAYRLDRDPARPLALSFRLSSPLKRPAGAEAALGLDWKPVRSLPVHLLAERRQALGREGRSAFAIALYGGVGDEPLGPLRVDAYAQAGIVGARSLDRFADGSLRISLPAGGRARFGGGAWAAAQPGLSRLDLGPQAALRLPVAGRSVTVAADWRVRIAGNAEPRSGPTLTLGTDF